MIEKDEDGKLCEDIIKLVGYGRGMNDAIMRMAMVTGSGSKWGGEGSCPVSYVLSVFILHTTCTYFSLLVYVLRILSKMSQSDFIHFLLPRLRLCL